MKSKAKEMHDVEIIIGQILRIGVFISATVIIIGLMLYLITGSSGYANNMFPTAPHIIFQGILALKPFAIIMLGIFLLILTPVLRVVVSIYAFYKESDHLYVIITIIVLIILIISMIIGYFGK
ncbi:DUF1634 domain-containing protein [Agrilactobacillus fermenti]|uniref:DUF1634 domain-containing protein n=1 Tax=Agrilactobacillus fermenti TaxID=2586909 RepID=UPI001E401447|nr:DUF1634 domain-containing protein [Agrilactobacillus fermenti]MCD2256827.1 DUF1634 domain-containing protein [Agrilactobacillus fermenti]